MPNFSNSKPFFQMQIIIFQFIEVYDLKMCHFQNISCVKKKKKYLIVHVKSEEMARKNEDLRSGKKIRSQNVLNKINIRIDTVCHK